MLDLIDLQCFFLPIPCRLFVKAQQLLTADDATTPFFHETLPNEQQANAPSTKNEQTQYQTARVLQTTNSHIPTWLMQPAIPGNSYISLVKTTKDTANTTKPLWFYPWVDLVLQCITAFCLYALFTQKNTYWNAYFIFISLLYISIATDSIYMLISRYASLLVVPLGWSLAALQVTSISFTESILGSCIGYFLLYVLSRLFFLITKVESIGQGDLELLALIGAFIGPLGCWMSLLIGSITGSIIGIMLLVAKKERTMMIPFGPFLAYGAISYVFLMLNKSILLVMFM